MAEVIQATQPQIVPQQEMPKKSYLDEFRVIPKITQQTVSTDPNFDPNKIAMENTNAILKRMKENGETYMQAFSNVFPKPVRDVTAEDDVARRQKMALFADIIRLAGETVTGFAGGNIYKRDGNIHNYLAKEMANEYAKYAQNMKDWRTKGVDAYLKDMESRGKIYSEQLASAKSMAPKVTTTTTIDEFGQRKDIIAAGQAEQRLAQGQKGLELREKDLELRRQKIQYDMNKSKEESDKDKDYNYVVSGGTKIRIPKNQYDSSLFSMIDLIRKDMDSQGISVEIEDLKSKLTGDVNKEAALQFVTRYVDQSPSAKAYAVQKGYLSGEMPKISNPEANSKKKQATEGPLAQ